MRIALIGYGKLGHLIEEVAVSKGHKIVARIDSKTAGELMTEEGLKDAEICIDFSSPSCVFQNIHKVIELGKPLVVGTTGWYDRLSDVRKHVEQKGVGFLYAPNFSVGVMLFFKMVEHAASLMDRFEEYDVGILERHHSAKIDAPSGTAEELSTQILKHLKRKRSVVFDLMDREIAPSELQIASVRCGYDPGTHLVAFDGPTDVIHLKHFARNRISFARGAVAAAEWLRKKKGFFSLEDMLNGHASVA